MKLITLISLQCTVLKILGTCYVSKSRTSKNCFTLSSIHNNFIITINTVYLLGMVTYFGLHYDQIVVEQVLNIGVIGNITMTVANAFRMLSHYLTISLAALNRQVLLNFIHTLLTIEKCLKATVKIERTPSHAWLIIYLVLQYLQIIIFIVFRNIFASINAEFQLWKFIFQCMTNVERCAPHIVVLNFIFFLHITVQQYRSLASYIIGNFENSSNSILWINDELQKCVGLINTIFGIPIFSIFAYYFLIVLLFLYTLVTDFANDNRLASLANFTFILTMFGSAVELFLIALYADLLVTQVLYYLLHNIGPINI
jgi:hypothetical protein